MASSTRVFLGLAVLVGCGPTVLVEDGEGGAGGANGPGSGANGTGASAQNGTGASAQNGTGASAQNGTGASSQNGTGGSTSALQQACIDACSRIDGCLADAGACVSECMAVNPSCAAPYIDWLECAALLVSSDTCDMPADCREPLGNWVDCEAWCIEGSLCGVSSEGDCSCSVNACGPTSVYSFQCFPGQPGSKCDCFADNVFLGSCVDAATTCDAEPANNCCLTLFFIPGG